MPDPNLCDITVVLDRSGSMQSVADDTIGGFNQFLRDQREAPGTATLTLVQFDTEYEFVHRALPIGAVPPLTRETFQPRGMTALRDALGRAIHETGARLAATPEPERPGRVIFVVMTDGQENSSREFAAPVVAELIRQQREVYSWDFLFLGANQDAILTAGALNIPASASLTYASTGAGNLAAQAASSKAIARSRRAATRGEVAPIEFLDEDRRLQEDLGA